MRSWRRKRRKGDIAEDMEENGEENDTGQRRERDREEMIMHRRVKHKENKKEEMRDRENWKEQKRMMMPK